MEAVSSFNTLVTMWLGHKAMAVFFKIDTAAIKEV
jgi:hypothetical protein